MVSRPTPLDGTHPVIAEVLAARGYRTGGFVSNLYCTREFGLARGFAVYEDFARSVDELLYHSIFLRLAANSTWVRRRLDYRKSIGFRSAENVNRGFLDWLDRGETRPFFAFLNYMEAHDPYFQAPPYDTRFTGNGGSRDLHERCAHRSHIAASFPNEVRAQVAAYEGGIASMDDAIRRLLADLEGRGALANTLVIITSDHGEQFGEHGRYGHAHSVHRVETHVPLLIRDPRRTAAERRIEPVTLRDLPATIMAALDLSEGSPFPGRSLLVPDAATAPHVRNMPASPVLSTLGRSAHDRGEPEFHALVIGRHRALVTVGGAIELYDLDADPRETNDLAKTAAGDRLIEPFRRQLRSIVGDLAPGR